jgi:hypothetical protein
MKGRRKIVGGFTTRQGLYVLGTILLFSAVLMFLIVSGYLRID